VNADIPVDFGRIVKIICGKIRRFDLRVQENACAADALMDEYRDRWVAHGECGAGSAWRLVERPLFDERPAEGLRWRLCRLAAHGVSLAPELGARHARNHLTHA
jgi:hypothetical protein